MARNKLAKIVVFIMLIFTIPDLIIHFVFLDLRSDLLLTIPMVGEAISEGFNVTFAIVILTALTYGHKKEKPIFYLIVGSILFYVSQLHDFLDEFFVLSIPSIAFEVFAFPLALIFATIGIFTSQQYEKKLNDENEKLKVLYREMSQTDSLTGLYNTRRFYESVPIDIEKSHSENCAMTLMILDVDDFKMVNDTFGHVEGDRLINKLGKLIKSEFSSSHHRYRYGGEEFVVVLPEVDIDLGIEMAEKFRKKFSQMTFHVDGHTYQKPSV